MKKSIINQDIIMVGFILFLFTVIIIAYLVIKNIDKSSSQKSSNYKNNSNHNTSSDVPYIIPKSITNIPLHNRKSAWVHTVIPTTTNEFKFFDFVENFDYIDQYYAEIKKQGFDLPLDYELAIQSKIKIGYFTNPFTFPEYFDSEFDYITIDFETANNRRISACAIGLVFIKSGMIVHQFKEYIKPPISESFLRIHTNIHGITSSDVALAKTYKELWDIKYQRRPEI